MKQFLTIFLFIFLTKSLFAQTTDIFGNSYCITNNVLAKTDAYHESKCLYTNQLYGDITNVDVSNPFRIMLFYKHFNTVIFLDDKLSFVSKIDLSAKNIHASVACVSSDNKLWIYDNITKTILLFDNNTVKFSKNISLPSEPIFIFEYQKTIIISTKTETVLLDNFCEIKSRVFFDYKNHFFETNKLVLMNEKDEIWLPVE